MNKMSTTSNAERVEAERIGTAELYAGALALDKFCAEANTAYMRCKEANSDPERCADAARSVRSCTSLL